MDRDYSVLLTAPGGGSARDITQLIRDITWQGNISKVPREWGATLALDKRDPASLPDLAEGCQITMLVDGKAIYTGPLQSVTTDSQSVLGDITSMDRGWYLAQNEGWYRFDGTPAEQIASKVCGDFGIPVGKLAATGSKIKEIPRRHAAADHRNRLHHGRGRQRQAVSDAVFRRRHPGRGGEA